MNKTIIVVLCGWLIAFSTAFAQTEVEGEVSGEWNAEGSPYIVIDNITIPEEDTLTILQGVEVLVLSEFSIIVHGVLIVSGSEEERVVIQGDEDNESPWTGIFFDKPDDTSTMSYTEITDCEICITLDATHNLELDHCHLNGSEATVFAERDLGDYRTINASNCVFTSTGDLWNFNVYACELIANDCDFQGEMVAVYVGGVLRLQDCTAVGAVVCRFGVLELIDCDFTLPDVEDVAQCAGGLPTSGFMRNCTLGGVFKVSSHNGQAFRVTDCRIEGNVFINDCRATLTNNTIGIDSLVSVEIDEGSVVLENNAINGELDLRDTRFSVIDNTVHFIQIRGEEGNNIITGNTISERLEIREGGQLTFENNVINGEIDIRNATNTVFRHNTIVANTDIRGASNVNFTQNTIISPEPANIDKQEMIRAGGRDSHIILNSNIFVGTYASHLFYISGEDEQEIEIDYNCFWMIDNYDRYNRYGNNIFLRDRINETNIITDPLLFDTDPLDIALQPISPCRNAGDPELDEDPDGTRADIGAAFFDHRIDHVPGIHSPDIAFAQRGEPFRYTAKSSDEEEVHFTFIGLPRWLQPAPDRDIIEDSLVLVGEVPDDEVDFTFWIIVNDNDDQVNRQLVSVRCIDQKPIGGFVSGRLTLENSPYYIASTLVIDHDETLTIEPGCEFIVRGLDFPRTKRLRVYVLGRLIMSGTEEDTIKFSPEMRGEEDNDWDGFRFFNADAHYRFEYLEFTNRMAMHFTGAARISISHSLFKIFNDSTSNRILNFERTNRISLHDNKFEDCRTYITHCGTVLIHDNYFQNSRSDISVVLSENVLFERNLLVGASFSSSNNDTVIISRCVFDSPRIALYLTASESGEGLIKNCTIYNSFIHASSSGESAVTIINSTFSGDSEIAIGNQLSDNGIVNVLYSNFFGYDSVFRYEAELGEGCIYEDPLFVDPENGVFWLSDDSPLIDAGHPELYLDPDTSSADLGAYFWAPDGSTGIQKSDIVPDKVEISLYPNPFNSSTTISFYTPAIEHLKIDIYDITGRKTAELTNREYSAGLHSIIWDASNLATGLYFAKLEHSGNVLTMKMLLVK